MLCREDVTILEINSEARIEFFLVFVALMKWGVPAYYGIQIIHLESKHVEILRAPFFPPPTVSGCPFERSTFWGKNSTSGNQETKSKPRWSRKHRRALASGRELAMQRISSPLAKLLPSQKHCKNIAPEN